MRQADLAEDIVQDAFVKAAHQSRPLRQPVPFLDMALHDRSADLLQPSGTTIGGPCIRRDARGGTRRGETSESELERDDRARLRGDMEQAILELTEVQRTIVLLFYQHDWPVWLVAQHLGLPEGTVKSHLHRARLKLRELLLVDDCAGSAP